jgi:hypothetical protein
LIHKFLAQQADMSVEQNRPFIEKVCGTETVAGTAPGFGPTDLVKILDIVATDMSARWAFAVFIYRQR